MRKKLLFLILVAILVTASIAASPSPAPQPVPSPDPNPLPGENHNRWRECGNETIPLLPGEKLLLIPAVEGNLSISNQEVHILPINTLISNQTDIVIEIAPFHGRLGCYPFDESIIPATTITITPDGIYYIETIP